LKYKEGKENLKKIIKIIKQKYPSWKKNKYYKKQTLIFKATCNIFLNNNLLIIKLYSAVRKVKK